MTKIFETSFERSLDQLVAMAQPGDRFEAWTFDDRSSREAAMARLAEKGVTARIRSAYKPLVTFFREEVDLDDVETIEIHYPVHPAAAQNRFRLEAYPLAALVGSASLIFVAREDAEFRYEIRLTRAHSEETLTVLAPNRVHQDILGETNVSPTGWLRRDGEPDGARFETDYERLFHSTMAAIAGFGWGDEEPYFEELNIRVAHPAADEPLPYDDEVLSLREALHEDFYFSLLEVFQAKSGRPSGYRDLRPGQIVPEIVQSEGRVSVSVTTRALSTEFLDGPEQEIDRAREPIAAGQIASCLETIGGQGFAARSRSGRTVAARYVKGTDLPVMISGGQHPNEVSGIIGCLRAALMLKNREGAHFTISPLENPDGYALDQRLRRDNPRHMHHAARYTALGDDLEYRTPENSGGHLNETDIRLQAQRMTGAGLHINLHGYPAHEWTRPLSGYVPRGFAMWTLPKGFFLVLRHHAGWEDTAEELLDRVTRHLSAIPGLLDDNARQIKRYETHSGETGFRIINGFPCLSSVDDRHAVPITLITEYPDETIYGQDLIAGHTAQMETVLSAYRAWQEIHQRLS
ncbi:M14 family metallopeptidase [Rhizobium sp. SSA_523]|uniref:M14 family metallopeptidase n=1 Tax=Rhizobium sp. SSA_523 TaxID=2952477 RepID=UPI0020903BD0|nr:M14 family metallopeptidase [Rhizobium sp. SSA_523]MCO5732589.1 M14 family metallopeptidase [Rhizobium sp. SSA_523]WKC23772.1 M14 family metallopeptidase [Rhizobium sp. SSA_523]